MNDEPAVPVTVIIPTRNRAGDLRNALDRMFECRPLPSEVLIHIDDGDQGTEELLTGCGYPLTFFKSDVCRGPGGGRDWLIKAASNELIASFDDDSYPIDTAYFERLVKVFEEVPGAAVVAARIFCRGEDVAERGDATEVVADFVGCGCAYRRSVYLQTRGYLELPVPYGVEESDLRFQLLKKSWKIVSSAGLRVYHDTELRHHANPRLVANTIANAALLAYLHYPWSGVPRGVLQVASVVLYALRRRRFRGIVVGLMMIPSRIWRFRASREPLSRGMMREFYRMRRA